MTPGAFVPDRDPACFLLARHRQPLAANVARAYIEALSAPGDLIIDPFASSPTAARVAYECGRRAIAVDSNPLVAFATHLQATLPRPRDIEIALARWGEITREDQDLRAHILEQYHTTCSNCGEKSVADYFLWSREPSLPVEKEYQCPRCGPRRDRTTEADRTRAAGFKPRGFHYHLILERLAADSSPHGNLLRERLISSYTPRNLYALVTLTLKLDMAARDEKSREVLLGCLLHALDAGTNLYPAPDALPERRTPEIFVEVNVWRALEQAASCLAAQQPCSSLAPSVEEVVSGPAPAVFAGHGAARAITGAGSGIAALVLTSPARLDPLFWELSYLWTRWLIGQKASQSLEPLLEEEHQRWGWFGAALGATLRDCAQLLKSSGHLVVAFPAGSHAMIETLALAASPSFRLDSLVFRPHSGATGTSEFGPTRGDYRAVWSPSAAAASSTTMSEAAQAIREKALEGGRQVLSARAEPLTFSWLHHGALARLAQTDALARTLSAPMNPRDNPYQFLHRELEAGLKEGYSHDFDHWQEPGRMLWVSREAEGGRPLAERVERAIAGIMLESKRIGADELEDRLLERFQGLLTPEIELVAVCAQAYAEQRDGHWERREEDAAGEQRALDLARELGTRLGFQVDKGKHAGTTVWRDERVIPGSSRGSVSEERVWEESHWVRFLAHPDLFTLLIEPAAPLFGMVILPESQIALTREKLRRLPLLKSELEEAGWHFLRLPYLERLLLSASLTRPEFLLAIGLDPEIETGRGQMELL